MNKNACAFQAQYIFHVFADRLLLVNLQCICSWLSLRKIALFAGWSIPGQVRAPCYELLAFLHWSVQNTMRSSFGNSSTVEKHIFWSRFRFHSCKSYLNCQIPKYIYSILKRFIHYLGIFFELSPSLHENFRWSCKSCLCL